MAHSYEYEEEEYFGDQFPLYDETLAGALGNTVQMSINNALERALGPLSVHFEKFARQKGWLPPIASSEEALSDQPSTSKGKAKAKSWPHSEIFKKLASSIHEDHGYSFSQAQEAFSSDSERSPAKSSGSDSEEDLGPKSSPATPRFNLFSGAGAGVSACPIYGASWSGSGSLGLPDLWGFGEAIRRQTLSALSLRRARLLLQAPAFSLVALTTVFFDALSVQREVAVDFSLQSELALGFFQAFQGSLRGSVKMANSYEDDEYFGDQFPLFDETLAGALGNTVQVSINNALERALGPLSVHFENFARQKGWLPPIASSEEALSDQPSTSKALGRVRARCEVAAFLAFPVCHLARQAFARVRGAVTACHH
ncbi:hypothetical protein NDU88_007460 [Pleurodeles waltl]|uniref:Uncharacterized protein n=1 Tax=Pleurodeles waltl TaxID=8319 RepID=A0AAV7WJB1_PLEWA|nr:hypothetical protein NDU88_007460 [Pleurodeles waltl]